MYQNKILKNIRALEYKKGKRNRNESPFSFRSQNFNNIVRNRNILLWKPELKNNKQQSNDSFGLIKTFSRLSVPRVKEQERIKKNNFLIGKYNRSNSMLFSHILSPSKSQIIFSKKNIKHNSSLHSTNVSKNDANNSHISYKDCATSRVKLSISSIDMKNDEETKVENEEITDEEEIHFKFVELLQKTKIFYAKIEQQRKDNKNGRVSNRNYY